MKMRFLGKTGVKVSELCLGTMTFGSRAARDNVGGLDQTEAIDRLSDVSGLRIAQRLARQALGIAPAGAVDGAGYLGPAVRHIDQALRAAGIDVPVLAFGHTHRPALTPFDREGGRTWYANAGSWARVRPEALRQRLGPTRRPFIQISVEPEGRPVPFLLAWDAVAGTATPFLD